MEELQNLEDKQKKENPTDKKNKKWKRKTKRCEIMDYAFSANSDGLSIADLSDDTQMSLETGHAQANMVTDLYSHILMKKLNKKKRMLI